MPKQLKTKKPSKGARTQSAATIANFIVEPNYPSVFDLTEEHDDKWKALRAAVAREHGIPQPTDDEFVADQEAIGAALPDMLRTRLAKMCDRYGDLEVLAQEAGFVLGRAFERRAGGAR